MFSGVIERVQWQQMVNALIGIIPSSFGTKLEDD